MLAGAVAIVVVGVWPAGALRLVAPVVGTGVVDGLPAIAAAAGALALFVAILALVRRALLRGRDVRADVTWGCGYRGEASRTQYTAASFADPLIAPFARLVHRRAHVEGPDGYFPTGARYEEQIEDLAGARLLVPATRRFAAALGRLRVIQQGRVQLYLTYVLITLIVLLIWQLR
jgi:hypothetical protein